MNKAQQIQEYILNGIKNREFEAGSKIPTEVELIDKFKVSRMTVNKALGVLREKGYIYSERGRGTYVKKEVVHKKLNELTSFTEEMKSRGIVPLTKILEFAYTSMGFDLEKESLHMLTDENVYKMVRVRYIDNIPMALDIVILNPKITGMIEFSKMNSSLYEFVQNDLGIVIDYSIQKIKAIKADDFLSSNLQIPIGDPVLKITGVTYDSRNVPFEVVHTYYVHDAYEFEQISTRTNI